MSKVQMKGSARAPMVGLGLSHHLCPAVPPGSHQECPAPNRRAGTAWPKVLPGHTAPHHSSQRPQLTPAAASVGLYSFQEEQGL